jgi:hypothetical protein
VKPEHIRALAEAELAGLSRAEIAAKTGLRPQTVSRYRHRAEVRIEVERLRNRPADARATDTLVRLLDEEDPKIALSAAQTLLLQYRALFLGASS